MRSHDSFSELIDRGARKLDGRYGSADADKDFHIFDKRPDYMSMVVIPFMRHSMLLSKRDLARIQGSTANYPDQSSKKSDPSRAPPPPLVESKGRWEDMKEENIISYSPTLVFTFLLVFEKIFA